MSNLKPCCKVLVVLSVPTAGYGKDLTLPSLWLYSLAC